MKPVVGMLQQLGIRMIIYLDLLIMHDSREELTLLIPLVCQFFQALGLIVNLEKSQLIPKQEIEFLGFLVNSASLHLAFPPEKMRKIQQDARTLSQCQSVSIRDLARFVGKTSASTKAIWQAPLHYRAIQAMINSVSGVEPSLVSKVSRFNVTLQLTAQAMKDLRWWMALDRGTLMVSTLLPRTPDLIIESDASNIGWGARQGEVRTGGRWSRTESSNHINHLELLAAFLAVQYFAKGKSNITIQLKLDNITAVSYINRMEGTHSQPLCNLAISVWDWSLQRGIYLIAEYLPGKQNVIADMESRTMRDRCDWMLTPNIFNRIQSHAK